MEHLPCSQTHRHIANYNKNQMPSKWSTLLTILLLTLSYQPSHAQICIIGSGIGGASVAHFLRELSSVPIDQIVMFERKEVVGGRMAKVDVSGETFEAGASILHPKNYHASNFTKLLGLKTRRSSSDSSLSFGIWDGKGFAFKTLKFDSKFPIIQKILDFANKLLLLARYGFSLQRMETFVQGAMEGFLKFYGNFEWRPVFETVDDMLKWAGLYNLTAGTLQDKLVDVGLSPALVQELVTVITRINYGQDVRINAFAGAVSLAGSGGGLWSVEGGNWQMAARLINRSNVELHLHEEIKSICYRDNFYELKSSKGNSYQCQVAVVATPLDEIDIHFRPPVSVPERKLQHTHATFVRGLLNAAYFGMNKASEIPKLIGTLEDPDIPFSSISVLKRHNEDDMTYKVFSREPMAEKLLDDIFSVRKETVRINWGAYPHYNAPEVFAPFVLDGKHLYYVNAFENAASTMETSAVAAENVARLILSRLYKWVPKSSPVLETTASPSGLNPDL